MRFAHYAILGFAALMLTVSAAQADNPAFPSSSASTAPRIFGSTNCREQFSCVDVNKISEVATNCSVIGLGISPQPGLFDGATADSNGCLIANLPSSGGNARSSAAQCCVASEGDMCSMRCQLLMY